MKYSPQITVVIPTYNQSHFLKQALKSVIDQTFADWEALVINNFSDDNTIEVVKEFNDSRIRLENFNNNGIISASRNRAIALSRGEYLAFLDSDDIWYTEKLEISLLRLKKGYGLVCHGLRWFGKRKRNQVYGPAQRATYDSLLYNGNCIATSATTVQKKLVEDVGGFSEDINIVTVEDYHLWLKLIKKGIKVDFINHILGGYRFHTANTGTIYKQAKAERYLLNMFFQEEPASSTKDKIKKRFRFGMVEYGIGRSLQADAQFIKAWKYLLKSIVLNPIFIKSYIAIIINIYLIFINASKYYKNK